MACRASSRTPGSRTKSSQLRQTCRQEPQVRNGPLLDCASPCSMTIRIISSEGDRRYGKLQLAPARIFPLLHVRIETVPECCQENVQYYFQHQVRANPEEDSWSWREISSRCTARCGWCRRPAPQCRRRRKASGGPCQLACPESGTPADAFGRLGQAYDA